MNRRGVTYVEILVVAGVMFSLTSGIALVMSEAGRKVWATTSSHMASRYEAQRVLDNITRELRTASQSELSCSGATLSSGPSLSFISALDGKDITYTYQPKTGQLIRRLGEDQEQVVARYLSDFTPTCLSNGNGVVNIRLTVQAPASYRVAAETVESAVWVRTPTPMMSPSRIATTRSAESTSNQALVVKVRTSR